MQLIGIGSPFGVDQLGWLVVERLAAQGWQDYQILDRPGLHLLEAMRGHPSIILVDAIQAPTLKPGTILTFDCAEVARYPQTTSSHGIGLAETLAVGQALDLLPEKLCIIGGVVEEGMVLDGLLLALEARIRGVNRL